MPDGLQETANAFQRELQGGQSTNQPRDDRGRFSGQPVERMFEEQGVEGDPETGDVRDGGDDPALRQRARTQERTDGEELSERQEVDAGEQHEDEGETGSANSEEEPEGESDEGAGQAFEITVDGQPTKVTLKEALQGYIRTETFHKRMNQVHSAALQVRDEATKVAGRRDEYVKKLSDLEADVQGLMPKEPDWDAEFARDPAAAHRLQKQFSDVQNKLKSLREEREKVEQQKADEQAAALQNFIAQGRDAFIQTRQFKNQEDYDRNVAAMRKTALAEGFQEQEIGQVFDPRMLNVLWKASMYDRITANRPKPVNPNRGKTLTPGSVNSSKGGLGRKGIDEAQKRLARSGSLDDAADFFRTILR